MQVFYLTFNNMRSLISYLFYYYFMIAMTDDDIDEVLKEKWIEIVNPYNDESIDQQMCEFTDLIKSSEASQDIVHKLKYQGKFYFIMGRYEQALADLTKLLECDRNDAFALRYRGETYYMTKQYEESLTDLNKLLKIHANDTWALKACEEVIRG